MCFKHDFFFFFFFFLGGGGAGNLWGAHGPSSPYPVQLHPCTLLSIESQNGTINIQRCSVENQKGAIAVQYMVIAPFWFSIENLS